jgi:tetratricopeptide (TPR) repeat protein/predicted Ser/Thr protein kinase
MDAGQLVADRFRVERTAGAGGMGTVYRALDVQTGEPVALKVLREAGSEDRVRRFAKEAEVLFKLRHPRIVRYIAHGRTDDGKLFLVMEWLQGESLGQRMRRQQLSVEEAFAIAVGCAEAIAAAHERGVLHRDIKPGNLLLLDGDVKRVRLLDFGLARVDDDHGELTNTGELLGTPGYMAPEQARGDKSVDARADVFSLGCVLFRCFTGRRAFEGEDALAVLAKLILDSPPRLSALRPGIPPELEALVDRMLAKSRDQRPPSGRAVLDELLAMESTVGAVELASLSLAPLREALPSITVKEQRVMCLVLARVEAASSARSDFLAGLQAAVQPFGGAIDRLIDGTLLVSVSSGAPAEQAARAGRCAMALRPLLGPVPMALAAGRGMVAAGALLGEAIDRAAALLALGRADGVRLDDAAAALMRDRFDLYRDAAGYVLMGTRAEEDYTRRLLGRETNVVGRARELANLEALFDECMEEPVARAVLVTAPAGVGKSRLRYELLRRLLQRGAPSARGTAAPFQIWLGRGDPMSSGSAFGMIASALRQATGVRLGEAPELRRHKLAARVAMRVPPAEQRRVAEFLGELTGAHFEEERSVQLRAARADPVLMGDQMRRAFEDFVAAECAALPLLLVLEDLHWGDLPSINFIDAALRNLSERPIMVLALARPEVHEIFPSLWAERDLQEVRLSRLTKKASGELVRQVLGHDATETIVGRLVERAEGNAFYLEELIRAVAEGRGEKLPESVLAMVQVRLEELDGEARRVLRGASVFGQVFWRGGVAALVGKKREIDLDDWLVALEEREMITRREQARFPDEREYVFRHALLREAAYATLTENDRELGHRLAGSWLEQAGEHEGVVLAEHFERGGDSARTVRWYLRAAEQALEGNDLQTALARGDRAASAGAAGAELGAIRLLQADAHRWRGEFAEMEQRARVAMDVLPRGESRWCKAVAEVGVACRALGKYDDLAAAGEELLRLRPLPHFEAAYTEAAARTAIQLFMIGWKKHGDALLERIAHAEQLLAQTHPATVGFSHHASAWSRLLAGDSGAYLSLSERAAERFDSAGDLRSVANARVHLGFGYIEVGAYREAVAALRDAHAAANRMGLHNVVASSLNNLGIALARLGELDEAMYTESAASRLAAQQGDRRVEGASRHYLATIHMLRGELHHAEGEATAASELLRVSPALRAHALATLAHVRLAKRRVAEALESAREAMTLLESLGGIEEGEALVRLAYAEALRANGDVAEARQVIAQALARLVARAEQIRDPRWRASFLDKVPDHARTMALAQAWLGRGGTISDADTAEEGAPTRRSVPGPGD